MTMTDVAITTYSTTEVCQAANLSYRVLDWWVRTGSVTPSIAEARGSGRSRVWSQRDLDVLMAMGRVWRDLNRLGLQMQTSLVKQLWQELYINCAALVALDTVMIGVSCD